MLQPSFFRHLASMLFALLLVLLSAAPVQALETVSMDLTITEVSLISGVVIITAHLTCSEPAQAQVHADASQKMGRTWLFGSGEIFGPVPCDPAGTTVIIRMVADAGTFGPGKLTVVESASVCAPSFATCVSTGQVTVEQTFRLQAPR